MRYENLGDICTTVTDYVANGSFKSLKENVSYESDQDGYAILIRLVDYRNNFKGPFQYIDKHGYEYLKKTKLFGNEIIISNVGAHLGTVFRAPRLNFPMSLGPNAIVIDTKYNNDYYYYFFISNRGQALLQSIVSGSAQPKFNKTEFKSLLVPVPSLTEQTMIANRLLVIDKKIRNNNQVNDNLLKQLKLSFNNLYLSLTDDKTFTLGELIFENISGDWGKAQSQGDFTNRVTIIRGADIDDLALGNSAKTPIRYIKNRALVNKHLLPNDVLVEISGGSPTQSTGRSLLVSDSVIDKFSSEVLGTNFTRIFRPSSEENSILFKSYLDFLYDKDVFFNYENGTTGIKNLDYKSVLKIQLPDIRKANNYQQYINLYKLYNNTVQSNGRQSVQLTKIRQAMLNNFF